MKRREAAKKNHFDQSGVIPYRKKNNKVEVMLVTSIRRKKWIIPKGFIEYHMAPLKVTRIFKDYPEKNLRKRKWLSVSEAAKKVEIDDLARMIRKLGRLYSKK